MFLYKSNIRTQKFVIFIWIIYITLFGGLRWEVGHDWNNYLRIFNESEWSNIFSYTRFDTSSGEIFEPFYIFLNVAIKTLFGHYTFFNIFEVLIIQLAYFQFSKVMFPKNPILCYCFLMLTSPAYIPVRITLSYAFVLLSYIYARSRNILKFSIYFLISISIHKHSIVALPIYWLGYIHLNSYIAIIIYLSFYIFSTIFQEYFISFGLLLGGTYGDKIDSYSYFETSAKTLSIMTVILNLIFLVLYLYMRKLLNCRSNYWYNSLINIFIIYCAVIFVFSEGMSDLVRLIDVFFPAQIILLLSTFLYSIRLRKNIISVFVPILFAAYCIRRIFQGFTDPFFEEVCVPYRTVLGF